ncbi:MAG: hypothetical protein HOV83_37585 [Catenulispora sp.]|nr:hypothetical protein [Catenulispora sp.]
MEAIALLLEELHEGESDLVHQLRRAAHQHATDFDVRHGATELSAWSEEHVRRLAEAGTHHGLQLSAGAEDKGDGVVQQLLEKTAKAVGRRPEPALLLLRDLRELYLSAARNKLNWEMLAQGAKALHDPQLLDLATRCQSQTVRQSHWAETLTKELAPQALTSLSPEEVQG